MAWKKQPTEKYTVYLYIYITYIYIYLIVKTHLFLTEQVLELHYLQGIYEIYYNESNSMSYQFEDLPNIYDIKEGCG